MKTKAIHSGGMTSQPKEFPIVGIGASAGGLSAFESFLNGIPPGKDMSMGPGMLMSLSPGPGMLMSTSGSGPGASGTPGPLWQKPSTQTSPGPQSRSLKHCGLTQKLSTQIWPNSQSASISQKPVSGTHRVLTTPSTRSVQAT